MPGTAIVVGVGASQGLGGALCRRFAREGLHVFAAGRTGDRLEAVVSEIEQQGGAGTAFVADTTIESDVAGLFDEAAKTGRTELVSYNAGNAFMGALTDVEAEDFERVWRVGCFGGFLVGREAARRMVPESGSGSGAGAGGTLVFTGATASLRARPPFTTFASAKAALRALAHGMAREFGPRGLHVGHVIVDGMIDGDQLNTRLPQLREQAGEDGMLSIDAIADAFWHLHGQHRSAWTLELDLRPYKESF